MAGISMKQLLEAGVHFGHQTKRWNPKMKKYIFTERNGIYIVDLQKTLAKVKEAFQFIKEIVKEGKPVLFVGTKKQAQDAVKEDALRCQEYYVDQRWLGGTLTNYRTIQNRIGRLKELSGQKESGEFERLTKKEQRKLQDELNRLERYLAGIKDMPGLPGVMFVIDSKKESIAVAEARKMEIPVVAIVDTNADPDEIDYPIPGNDDAIRAIKLFTSALSEIISKEKEEIIASRKDEMSSVEVIILDDETSSASETEAGESVDQAEIDALKIEGQQV